MAYHSPDELLSEVLHVSTVSSHVAGMLASGDLKIIVGALQVREPLTKQCRYLQNGAEIRIKTCKTKQKWASKSVYASPVITGHTSSDRSTYLQNFVSMSSQTWWRTPSRRKWTPKSSGIFWSKISESWKIKKWLRYMMSRNTDPYCILILTLLRSLWAIKYYL